MAMEFGKCEMCGKDAPLKRTYYNYDFNCSCCSPTHFVMIRHCVVCEPKEPMHTKILVETSSLKKIEL